MSRSGFSILLLAKLLGVVTPTALVSADLTLDIDDECIDPQQCSLNALQLRGQRVTKEREYPDVISDAIDEYDTQDWDTMGDWDMEDDDAEAWESEEQDGEELETREDMTEEDEEAQKHIRRAQAPTQRKMKRNFTITYEKGQCGSIDAEANSECEEVVKWAAKDGKWDRHGWEWFGDIQLIAGTTWTQATLEDFQRLYFCAPPGGKTCYLPPCNCSDPPCDTCFAGARPKPTRPGCDTDSTSIGCKPPKSPMGYKGHAWPTMSLPGTKEMHIFAIGDWGGMDGSLNPTEGRNPIVAYPWGKRQGPSVFPRTRWDKWHNVRLCGHSEFVECFETWGGECAEGCGFIQDIDTQPQTLVATAFKQRAALKDPQFILNVGDNFYWGGIEKTCGTPMDEISFTAFHQFNQIFEGVYNGYGLDKKPWLSVLGNHDWGGRVFNNGWDQQIAYTWASDRWIMPAPYWSQHVEFPDLDFNVDIYMIDSNFIDAKEPSEDSEHNLCGSKHNPPDANCSVADGPASIESCPQFFKDLWVEQQSWLEGEMAKSTATWQIVVTHFPCGHEMGWYRKLRQEFGLDLLVTGHRHDQELWRGEDYAKNHMGGLTCIVTGGGGGITSEATPDPKNTRDWYGEAQYGFYDLVISQKTILIQSINWDGTNVLNHTVYPK